MKANNRFSLSLILFILFILVGAPMASAAGKVYKWRYQGFGPAASRHRMEQYAKTVEKYTMGRIKLQVFTVDQLVPAQEVLNAVKDGVLDMASTIPAFHAPPITTGLLLSSPVFYVNSDMEGAAFRETFKGGRALELMREEFAENGVHFIAPEYAGACALLAKKPMTTLNDLKGLKPEAIVPDIAIFLKNLGVSSQFVPMEEIYLALSTGSINGATIGGAGIYTHDIKLAELAHYLHKPYLVYSSAGAYIVNQKNWNKLPEDLKLALEAATRIHTNFQFQQTYIEDIEAQKEGKFEIVEFDEELKKAMYKAAIKSWDEVAKMSPRAAELAELIKEWNRMHGYID